jgi:nucleotide-binding universal stress UspA family protein
MQTAVLAIKPDADSWPLVDLACQVLPSGASVHLVSFVRVGKDEDEPERLEAAREALKRLSGPLVDHGLQVQHVVELVLVAAGADLVRFAEEVDADLIITGLVQRSRVGKALIGSDAQRILLSASCPVLSTHL